MFKLKRMDRLIMPLLLLLHMPVYADNTIGSALQISATDQARYRDRQIDLLGAIDINSLTSDGKKMMEFSGLAWDDDEQLLYALSDRGYVVQLRPVFNKGRLTGIRLIAYHQLRDNSGKPLVYRHADSEGLEIMFSDNGKQGDTELLVSFERIPRLLRYRPDGGYLGHIPLPAKLAAINNYAGENKSLEALAYHPRYQYLLGTERPLATGGHSLFSADTSSERSWQFTPVNETHGSLVGLTVLPNGKLVLLERSFPGVLAGVTSSLHLIELTDHKLNQQKLVMFKPADGLFNDNFEGISWHRGNRFFMISDDNDSLLQRTVLLYFAVTNLDKQLGEMN